MRLQISPLQLVAVENEPFIMKVLHYGPWLIAALLAVLPLLAGLVFVFAVALMALVVAKVLELPYFVFRVIFKKLGLFYKVRIPTPPPEDF